MIMRLKVKKQGIFWDNRSDEKLNVDNIILREDLLSPEKEHISLYFKNSEFSGIVQIDIEEAQAIADLVSNRKKVVDNIKFIGGEDLIPLIEKKKSKKKAKKRK